MANPFPEPEAWLPGFASISPLFDSLADMCKLMAEKNRWPGLDDFNALLNASVLTASGRRLVFVPQCGKALQMEETYEARIFLSGEVQTRTENWHDFFNALVWLSFPRTKAALNARHFELIKAEASNGNRCKTRDVLTLFDESGLVVLYSDDSLAELIRDFRWKELFWARRHELAGKMQFMIFGHSLYEKALRPYIGLTGKAMLLKVPSDFLCMHIKDQVSLADDLISRQFDRNAPNPVLTPLPVLGVPGWWNENKSLSFYENTGYFREKKRPC